VNQTRGVDGRTRTAVTFQIQKSATGLRRSCAGFVLLEALKAVDRHLNLRTDLRLGSTDANIPSRWAFPRFRWARAAKAAGPIPGRMVLGGESRAGPAPGAAAGAAMLELAKSSR